MTRFFIKGEELIIQSLTFQSSLLLSLCSSRCLTAFHHPLYTKETVLSMIYMTCPPFSYLPESSAHILLVHWAPGTLVAGSCRSCPVYTCLGTSARAVPLATLFLGQPYLLVPPFFQRYTQRCPLSGASPDMHSRIATSTLAFHMLLAHFFFPPLLCLLGTFKIYLRRWVGKQ